MVVGSASGMQWGAFYPDTKEDANSFLFGEQFVVINAWDFGWYNGSFWRCAVIVTAHFNVLGWLSWTTYEIYGG